MDRATIDAVVRRLRPTHYGWWCELPNPVRFFGQPVELQLDTRPFREDNEPPPAPARAEVELVRLILAGLPGVLAECERRHREYDAKFPWLLDKLCKPYIWVSREWLGDAPPGDWSFVVGIADVPEWGIHSEFRGLEFQELWSGY